MEIGEAKRRRMIRLLSMLIPESGAKASAIDGVTLIRSDRSSSPVPVLFEPCIAIVAQGKKRFLLPDLTVTYDRERCLVLTIPVPGNCETIVADDGPFLGLAVKIDLDVVAALLIQTESNRWPASDAASAPMSAKMDAAIGDASLRLVECLVSPLDAKVLGRQLVREVLYRALCGEPGSALRTLVTSSESRTRVHRMLQRMHEDFKSPSNIARMAEEFGVGVSTLHEHFREITGTSPIQYLKNLRLHKACILMIQQSFGPAEAAEQVGYVSASQFSREFRRLFGLPPAAEAQRVRASLGLDLEALSQ